MERDGRPAQGRKDGEEIRARLVSGILHQLSVNNWSMKKLSDRSGVPYDTLKKLVSGRIVNPSFGSVLKIADAFGCGLDELIGRRDGP